MTSVKIEYPGSFREKVDDFAHSLPGWYGSSSGPGGPREHAIDVPSEAIADAIEKVLTLFGDDIQVTYRA